jgi:hypothetical protein
MEIDGIKVVIDIGSEGRNGVTALYETFGSGVFCYVRGEEVVVATGRRRASAIFVVIFWVIYVFVMVSMMQGDIRKIAVIRLWLLK